MMSLNMAENAMMCSECKDKAEIQLHSMYNQKYEDFVASQVEELKEDFFPPTIAVAFNSGICPIRGRMLLLIGLASG